MGDTKRFRHFSGHNYYTMYPILYKTDGANLCQHLDGKFWVPKKWCTSEKGFNFVSDIFDITLVKEIKTDEIEGEDIQF